MKQIEDIVNEIKHQNNFPVPPGRNHSNPIMHIHENTSTSYDQRTMMLNQNTTGHFPYNESSYHASPQLLNLNEYSGRHSNKNNNMYATKNTLSSLGQHTKKSSVGIDNTPFSLRGATGITPFKKQLKKLKIKARSKKRFEKKVEPDLNTIDGLFVQKRMEELDSSFYNRIFDQVESDEILKVGYSKFKTIAPERDETEYYSEEDGDEAEKALGEMNKLLDKGNAETKGTDNKPTINVNTNLQH